MLVYTVQKQIISCDQFMHFRGVKKQKQLASKLFQQFEKKQKNNVKYTKTRRQALTTVGHSAMSVIMLLQT